MKSESVCNETAIQTFASTLENYYSTEDQKRQLQREKDHRDEFLGNHLRKEEKLELNGRGSQTQRARRIRSFIVPSAAYWLDKHYNYQQLRTRNVGHELVLMRRVTNWVDSYTLAHIGLTVILDLLGRGTTFKTPMTMVRKQIGECIEDQAFIAYMEQSNPGYFEVLQKIYLHDPVRRYDKKIFGMKHALLGSDEMQWKWMTNEEHVRLGSLVLRAVMQVQIDEKTREGFFETKVVRESATKTIHFLGFSKTGVEFRDIIQEMQDENVFQPTPMVCPPLPWSLTERGGYLMQPPRHHAALIHNGSISIPSRSALDALNRLQSQPFQINKFIYHLQKELVQKTNEIGCFRSYEKDSWEDEHFPVYSSEYIASLEKGSDERKKVMRELTEAYRKQKLDEREALTPHRILKLAEQVLDETFYTPWYFDGRLRMYPATALSITGGDFVKGLLVNANPKPITPESYEELLIAIATSGDFEKVSKKPYADRLAWAKNFAASGELADMVLNPQSNQLWRKADEPFQFLAYCEEFLAVFIKGWRNTLRVFVGRDMTCSGIQILSSVIGDEKGMRFTNVIPSDTPQDAYGEVARVARELLSNRVWLTEKIQKREEDRVKWNAKHPDEKPRKKRMQFTFEIERIDRGIVKTQVMVTGYGGSFLRKREYILKQLKDSKIDVHIADRGIVVDACIEGMDRAFEKYGELNEWFKEVATQAIAGGNKTIQWRSPNGSLVIQRYNELLTKQIKTYAAAGGSYKELKTDNYDNPVVEAGYGGPRMSKHQSAIAANFTHTLDACMIQDGVNSTPDHIDVVTVHDCCYTQPGYLHEMVPHFRQSFLNVVTTPVLENLLEENDLEGVVPMIDKNEVDVSVCLESEYMFS